MREDPMPDQTRQPEEGVVSAETDAARRAHAEAAAPEQQLTLPDDDTDRYQQRPATEEQATYPPRPAPSGTYAHPPYRPYAPPMAPASPRRRGVPWYGWLIGGCLALLLLTGVGCALVGGVVGGAVWKLAHEPERSATVSRTFAVTGALVLNVQDDTGSVTLRRGDAAQVLVTATKHARGADETEANRVLDSMTVDTMQAGNTITVTAHSDTEHDVFANRRIDLVVIVPQAATVTTTLSTGRIDVTGITGKLDLTTDTGEIRATDVTLADGSLLKSDVGAVSLNGALAPGASVTAQTNTGAVAVALPANVATHVDARTDTGAIDVTGFPLTPSRHDAGATLAGDLGAAPTGTLTLRTDTGSITLRQR